METHYDYLLFQPFNESTHLGDVFLKQFLFWFRQFDIFPLPLVINVLQPLFSSQNLPKYLQYLHNNSVFNMYKTDQLQYGDKTAQILIDSRLCFCSLSLVADATISLAESLVSRANIHRLNHELNSHNWSGKHSNTDYSNSEHRMHELREPTDTLYTGTRATPRLTCAFAKSLACGHSLSLIARVPLLMTMCWCLI